MPVTQPSDHRSGRKSHSLEGMLMCSLRGSLCSGILFIPVGTKLPSKLPNAPLQPLSGQGGILQALEPAWESKEAVSVSLGAGSFWRHNGGGSHLFSQKPVCIFKQTFIQALKRAGDWQKNPKSQVNGSIHNREVWPENPSARVTTTALLLEAVEAAAARHSQSHVPERIEKPLWKQHGGSKEGHRPHTTAASHC